MQSVLITKYGFRIRTRNGAVVDNLSIHARSEPEAREKLQRMYNGCEILASSSQEVQISGKSGHLNYEDVVDLLSAA